MNLGDRIIWHRRNINKCKPFSKFNNLNEYTNYMMQACKSELIGPNVSLFKVVLIMANHLKFYTNTESAWDIYKMLLTSEWQFH